MRNSAGTTRADFVLPVTTHAEAEGSFTNHEGRLQRFWKALDAPGMARPAWFVLGAVLANAGQANAATGVLGMEDAVRSAATVAEALGCDADDVLLQSTGVIGKRIKRYFYADTDYPWMEIVGVVGNVRGADGNLQNPAPLSFYLPNRQSYSPSRSEDLRMMIRTRSDPAAALESIRDRIMQFDRNTVLAAELTMNERLDNSTRAQRANMFLLVLLVK